MTKKHKMKKRERTTCQTGLTNRKPSKPKRLCISSVKQRLSRPSKHIPHSLGQKARVCKNGWFVTATRTFQCAEGRVVSLIHESYQGKTPYRLASSEALTSPSPPTTYYHCCYSLYPWPSHLTPQGRSPPPRALPKKYRPNTRCPWK